MTNKEKQIKEFQSAPYQVGEIALIAKKDAKIGGNSRNEDEICAYKILGVNKDNLLIEWKGYGTTDRTLIDKSKVIKKDDYEIGYNPFKEKRMPRIQYYNIDIWQLLNRCGYDIDGSMLDNKDRRYFHKGIEIKEVTFDPYVHDKNGVKQYYQRGFVWSEDQKRALISSIYDELNIGTFLMRNRAYKECERLINQGETEVAFKDMVDGKQRANAIIEFIQGNFADRNGEYFYNFSDKAQRMFLNYDRLSFGMIEEGTPDQNVIFAFLNENNTGVPVEKLHIDKIKKIEF